MIYSYAKLEKRIIFSTVSRLSFLQTTAYGGVLVTKCSNYPPRNSKQHFSMKYFADLFTQLKYLPYFCK